MIEYRELEIFQSGDPLYMSLCRLHQRIFTKESDEQIAHSLAHELMRKQKSLVLLAVSEQEVVGYKIGYEEKSTRFYSWLGGVDSAWRGKGIASTLMQKQHTWCREFGYHVIRTQTKNSWREMLILNLRHGFNIVGTTSDARRDGPKIILEKWLPGDVQRTSAGE